ncbi:hypothetical protein [Priestia megaterium]|uniref:Uncharacterized protein n=1 Tax=Priestia megaterium TaxID=1404 RepID=A0A6M6EB40_PRIMG|nr:hypothetical protein [Priestia megaterium]QJX80745.1 hypothetical protein FDZ14_32155 [Priestia megaterium]
MRKLLMCVDIGILPIFSLVFVYGYFVNALSLGKTLYLIISYLLMLTFLFLAKKTKKKINCFLAYLFSLLGIINLLNALNGQFENINGIDIAVILVASGLAAAFKLYGYIFTATIISFWYAVYEYVSNGTQLKSFLHLYMKNQELYNYLSPMIIAFGLGIGFVLSSIVNAAKIFLAIDYKLRPEVKLGGVPGYYSPLGSIAMDEDDDPEDDNNYPDSPGYTNYYGDDDTNSNSSSGWGSSSSSSSSSNRSSNWGMTQNQIDYKNDRENYGKTTNQIEREREEREYGLPSYARDKD